MFLEDFGSLEDVLREFNIENTEWAQMEVLLAYYGCDGYDGESFMLLRLNGVLYENTAYHCSCYGLEEGWEPEVTSVEALKYRAEKGELKHHSFWPQLEEVLGSL